jgi:polyisoprenoid-binding protein YceI
MKKFIIDNSHSEVGFKVKHLMISSVKGNFGSFSGELSGSLENLNIMVNVSTSSVNTNNENRDQHLTSPDFFDCENHPSLTFESKSFDVTNKTITGDLTIKGVTHSVSLDCDYNGMSVDPWGNTKHGFEISGNISRGDFDLSWNSPLETGGVLVGDQVRLSIDLQILEEVSELITETQN